MGKKLTAFFALLCCSFTLSAANAALSKGKKTGAIYSATEEGPSEEVISSAPGYSGTDAIPTTQSAPLPIKTDAPALAPASARYDAVPSSQTEPLIRRLHLVEQLISKHGRAYDYRTATVTQLQEILGNLDSQASQTNAVRQKLSKKPGQNQRSSNTASSVTQNEARDSIGSEAPELPSSDSAGQTD